MIIFTYVRIQTSNVLRENELRSFEYAYQYYIWKQLENGLAKEYQNEINFQLPLSIRHLSHL